MPESVLAVPAHAKINLALDVLGKRPDGYHEVLTVLQPLTLADTIAIEAGGSALELTCSDPEVPGDEGNLVLRAARLLQVATGVRLGARIHIQKRIPVAAGLGGGSADAAAALLGLNQVWGAGLMPDQLSELAAQIGSDVPFSLLNHTALGEGRGERLTLLPAAPSLPVVLAVPQVQWPGPKTATVYRALRVERIRRHPDIAGIRAALAAGDVRGIGDTMENVLEHVAVGIHPVIRKLKKAMLGAGALGACMTGAGPAVVALAESAAAAEVIAAAVRPGAQQVMVTETLRPGVLRGAGA